MGKFTIVSQENPESAPSPFARTETAETNKQQESAENSVDSFTLKTTQQPRRKRQPRTVAAPTVSNIADQAAAAPANYTLWAQVLIASSNTVVVTWLGPDSTMEKREADMMEPPLARMLSRLPAGQAEQFSKFVDPMIMLIALGMWGNRIVKIQRAKRGDGITEAEFNRASGIVGPAERNDQPFVAARRDTSETRQQTPSGVVENSGGTEPPPRSSVEVNPNGVPTAITSQMGDF